MATALWFKTLFLVSLLLLMPFSYGMVEGFEGGMKQAVYSIEQGGTGKDKIEMSSTRKLLIVGGMLDYDDTGANPKHDPRKRPGKP